LEQFPRALKPLPDKVTGISAEIISQAAAVSRKSPRRRVIFPFHKSNKDTLHRMLNVIQPGSYTQPHRHMNPPKAEAIIVIRGSGAGIIFDEKGEISDVFFLSTNSNFIGVDLEPGVFHTFLALEEDTVLFEAKQGPYDRTTDKDFAVWAPSETSGSASAYMNQLYDHIQARV